MFDWFYKKGVKQGILWAIMIYPIGSLNDVFAKFLGDRLHWTEIAFFRFFFSTIIVLIPMLFSKRNLFKSTIHKQHVMRGTLGAVALGICCLSVNLMPLVENSVILFSEVLFMFPLSVIFLKEKINVKSIIATVIGFIGLLIMFRPKAENINLMAVAPTIAAFLFAVMNIMIKKMVEIKENTLTMLFYFGLYATITSALVVPFYWIAPNIKEMGLISLLGLGANIAQLFIFLAYRAAAASILTPIRYTELPFAVLFGFIFFKQVPDSVAFLGASLIIICDFISSRARN
jgi:S-adenosylmethionine uptake transporter